MAWYGPRGNCGRCAGDCSCQLPCQCLDGRFYKSYTTTLSNFPAAYVHTSRSFGNVNRHTFYGLEQLNGSYTFEFYEGEFGCSPDAAGFTNPIIYPGALQIDFGNYVGPNLCDATYTSSMTLQCRIRLYVIGAYWAFDYQAVDGSLCGTLRAEGSADFFGTPTCFDPDYDCSSNQFATFTDNLRDWYPQAFSMFPSACPAPDVFVTSKYCVNYTNIGQQNITGWQYTYSDLPASFDVRVGSTETVYRCSGVDALNGVYEVARREDLDCATGSASVEVPITADRYTISTSTPCLETPDPGGSGLTGTATLRVPPLSGNNALIINIDGESFSKGYPVSESWDPHTCDTVTEEFNEADPCLANPSPWLTIEGVPTF